MTTPRPELLPEGATLITWALTPEAYAEKRALTDWRQWGEGPWQDEPDRLEWRSPGSELPRMAIRNHFGAWCGYVGVPKGHRLFGKVWDDPECESIEVHGGITYGNTCAGIICHVPQPGESDHVWWLGFDCAHAFDYTPGMAVRFGEDVYRDVAYIIHETERLARQCEAGA
jgi:hypothetical protein